MGEKKDIGQAFREGLQQLKKSPNEDVWDKIMTQLDTEKKKTPIFPLWAKVTGIASVFLLISLGAYNYLNPSTAPNKPLVIEKEEFNPEKITPTKSLEVTHTNQLNQSNVNKSDVSQTTEETKANDHTILTLVNDKKAEIKKKQNQSSTRTDNNASVPSESKKGESETEVVKQNNTANKLEELQVTIAEKSITDNNTKTPNTKTENLSTAKSDGLASKNQKKTALQKTNKKLTLTLKGQNVENRPKKRSKWELAFHIAPIYYNSLTKGSSLDPALTDNVKQSILTSSYGLSASYSLIDRVKLRSGINRMSLSYRTYQVLGLDITSGTFSENTDHSYGDMQLDLTQKIQYLEIPLEIKYQLLDRKISVDLISGISALLLSNNSVLIEDSILSNAMTFTSEELKVNNLNAISFSGNLGIGINYNFSKKVSFNIEPIVKVQFNTYNTTTSFNPYMFGVFGGGSYKF